MDFNWSPRTRLSPGARSWLDANLPKGATKATSPGRRLDRSASQWHNKMHAAGWVGISWPKEYGGRGASLVQQVIYQQEIARANPPTLVNGLGILLVGPTLIHWGTEEQKKRYVPKILSAEEIWCQGYSEPGAGSDVASLSTRAIEEGDYFIVNGQKVWTSDAHHADLCILLVRTDPDAPKHKGISYILVDMHSPGVRVRPLVQITGDANFNEVFFEDVKVPKRNLIGEKNQGWQVAITTLMFERSGIGGGRDMLGAGEGAQEPRATVRHNGATRVGQLGRAPEDFAVRVRGAGDQVHRLSPDHPAPQGFAARSRGLGAEAVRQRTQFADEQVRDGAAGAV